MQRTEKYFEQDAFRTECESVILAAEPDEKTGGGRIALDALCELTGENASEAVIEQVFERFCVGK